MANQNKRPILTLQALAIMNSKQHLLSYTFEVSRIEINLLMNLWL